jgi:hypothetical protein
MNDIPQCITDAVGTIGSIHPRGFGFVVFTTGSGRKIRIYFHLTDSDGTAFEPNDKVCFDLGVDSQNRPRAYNVRFVQADKPTGQGELR